MNGKNDPKTNRERHRQRKPQNRSIHAAALRLSYDIGTQITSRMDRFPNLAPLQLRAMREIWHLGECTPNTLCGTLKRDKGQVSRIIDELCKADMVVRKPNPDDGRSKLVTLTDAGHEVFEYVDSIEQQFASQLTQGISTADLTTFFSVSDRLAANLQQIDP